MTAGQTQTDPVLRTDGVPQHVLQAGEADLRAKEPRLQAILHEADEAIVVIDVNGVVKTFNRAASILFGYPASEVVGGNVDLLLPAPPDGEAAPDGLARWFGIGGRRTKGMPREITARHRDGSEFQLELAMGELFAEGSDASVVAFLRDPAVREQAEIELRQAQKMEALGQLTGGIAHDFNNLLTILLGNLELLEERLSEDSDLLLVRETADVVRTGAELPVRLLTFARRNPLEPKPVDLGAVIEDTATLLRRTIGATFEVHTSVPEKLPSALVDPGQLQNALLNLALNARDAMPGGGMIRIEVTAIDAEVVAGRIKLVPTPAGYLRLSVTDSGTGMSPEVRAKACEPFFTTKPVGVGTGLGRAMVYGFAEQSGGYAEIDSELGRGTTVHLYLPQASSTTVVAVPAREQLAIAFPGGGETILVVEDDHLIRRNVEKRLSGLGYQVLTATHGATALKILEDDVTIDLLFTDMVMPGGMTGQGLAEAAWQHRPGLRVVFTSGNNGIAAGALWLRKPYTALDLARTLRQALDDAANGPGSASSLGDVP